MNNGQPARWIRMHSTRTEVTATTPREILSPIGGPIEVHFEDDAGSVVTIDGDKRSLLRMATQIIEAAVIANARIEAIAADRMLRKIAEQEPKITREQAMGTFTWEVPHDVAAKIQEGRVGGFSINDVGTWQPMGEYNVAELQAMQLDEYNAAAKRGFKKPAQETP